MLAACPRAQPGRPLYRFADEAPAAAPVAVPATDEARVAGEQLLDLALEAKGGRAQVLAARTLHATGTIELSQGSTSVSGTFERWLAPDRQRLDVTIDGRTISVIVAGDEAVQRQGTRTVPIDGAAADQLVDSLWRDRDAILTNLLAPTATARATGTDTVDGVACDALTVARAGQPLARLLLDHTTHQIVRIEALGDDAGGHEDDGDYRDVDGLRVAHRVAIVGPGARSVMTLETVDLAPPSDDVFALSP